MTAQGPYATEVTIALDGRRQRTHETASNTRICGSRANSKPSRNGTPFNGRASASNVQQCSCSFAHFPWPGEAVRPVEVFSRSGGRRGVSPRVASGPTTENMPKEAGTKTFFKNRSGKK